MGHNWNEIGYGDGSGAQGVQKLVENGGWGNQNRMKTSGVKKWGNAYNNYPKQVGD